jgi:hypothetical protein
VLDFATDNGRFPFVWSEYKRPAYILEASPEDGDGYAGFGSLPEVATHFLVEFVIGGG